MISFLLSFLIGTASAQHQGCLNFIAQSEIPKAIALQPNAGAKQCGGDDPCICFDGIVWQAAQWDGQTLSNDPSKLNGYMLKHPKQAKALKATLKAPQAPIVRRAKTAKPQPSATPAQAKPSPSPSPSRGIK